MSKAVHTGIRGVRDSLQSGVVIGRIDPGKGPAQLISFAALQAAQAPGSAAAVAYADAEVPVGTINGVNAAFTLAKTPSPAASLQLFKNGVLLRPGGVDYTLAAATITYVAGAIPQTGDTHVAWYRF